MGTIMKSRRIFMTMVCLLMCLASYSTYGDLQPRFPGGEEALMAFIEKEMKYPDESVKYGEQGRVVIEFTVDKKGNIVNPRVIRTATPLLDREALRIISKMPRWLPGKRDWMYVDMKYILPIIFSLDEAAPKLEKRSHSNIDPSKIVKQWPSFPGGDMALQNFINREMDYLPAAMRKGDQGKVIVRFLIDSKGNVVKPRIYKGISSSIDREALRIVSKMPRWKPAKMLNGRTAEHWWTIVINFDFTPIG